MQFLYFSKHLLMLPLWEQQEQFPAQAIVATAGGPTLPSSWGSWCILGSFHLFFENSFFHFPSHMWAKQLNILGFNHFIRNEGALPWFQKLVFSVPACPSLQAPVWTVHLVRSSWGAPVCPSSRPGLSPFTAATLTFYYFIGLCGIAPPHPPTHTHTHRTWWVLSLWKAYLYLWVKSSCKIYRKNFETFKKNYLNFRLRVKR